jgi:hypothetical protein
MSDESIYCAALTRLSFITSGSADFEKIARILIKFIYPEYDFNPPEGGLGTKDGGYDGYDPIKKAKLACSLNKDYEIKIKSEVEKSKKNGDKQLFYFSNQIIPEVEKNRIKTEYVKDGIELIICGIDILSKETNDLFQIQSNPELYDLLCLSSLKVGERYRRGDVKPFNIEYNGNKYKKQVIINDGNLNAPA